jgi:sugar lactone lactonase YvrE
MKQPTVARIFLALTLALGACSSSGTAARVLCGMTEATVMGVTAAEGLAISPDGTIYWTNPFGGGGSRFLGRHRPPYTDAPELNFVEIGPVVLGITYDPKRRTIYAGQRGMQQPALLAVDLTTTPPAVTTLTTIEPGANGVILGADDAVYFTTQDTNNVWRFDLTSRMLRKVNTAPVPDPNGLAFGPDGNLYVLTYVAANVTQLKLANGVATAQEMWLAIGMDARNADGIAFDRMGNMYVTAAGLFKITPQKVVTRLRAATDVPGANIEFGVGALRCSDMYIAGGSGRGIARITNDVEGLETPWHRQ